jgi:hypothetical protein
VAFAFAFAGFRATVKEMATACGIHQASLYSMVSGGYGQA